MESTSIGSNLQEPSEPSLIISQITIIEVYYSEMVMLGTCHRHFFTVSMAWIEVASARFMSVSDFWMVASVMCEDIGTLLATSEISLIISGSFLFGLPLLWCFFPQWWDLKWVLPKTHVATNTGYRTVSFVVLVLALLSCREAPLAACTIKFDWVGPSPSKIFHI